nr:uncharacterized protein LOC109184127 [Ipomoea batatas]
MASKRVKRFLYNNPDEGFSTAKAHIFRRLEQMITAADLQTLEGTSLIYLLQSATYHSFQAQLAHAGPHGAIKALTKDSELLKAAKATHAKEVKGLKAVIAKLNASLTEEQERAKKDQWRIFNTRITKDEVHSVLFDMAPFKFLGPDGFHVAFYQQMWGIVGDNMSNLVRNVVDTSCLPDGLNDTLLVLIPKVRYLETIKHSVSVM